MTNSKCPRCDGNGWVITPSACPAYSEHGDLEREPCPWCNGNEISRPDLSGIDWDNDLFFFTYEYSDETSQFDPKGRWVYGAEYYERTYRVRVPLAFRMCDEMIEAFVQMMEEKYPGIAEGFYVD